MKKFMMTCLTALLMMAPLAAHAQPVRVIVGPRFFRPAPVRVFVGPRVGFRFGWAAPYWGPRVYPGYWGPYAYAPVYEYTNPGPTGAVRFDTNVNDAQVYIDGAYAGTVGNLKTMALQPGSYNIEVKAPDGAQFAQKVFISPGETLHLNPDLRSFAQPQYQP